MAHTRGIWTVGRRDATQIFAGPERLIAEACDRARNPALDIPREEALANARLMAAAPALLAGLSMAVFHLENPGIPITPDSLENLKTALARAEGKA